MRDFYAGEPDWDRSSRETVSLGYEINHQLANGWDLSQSFRYEKFDWEYYGHYVKGLANGDTEITRGANRQVEHNSGISLDTRLAGYMQTGLADHELLFGLDIRRYDAESLTEFYDSPSFAVSNLNWQDPDYGNVPAGNAWYTSTPDITQTQIGAYAQDEVTLGRFSGSFALRYDWSKQEGTTYTNYAGHGTVDQSDTALTGRAGIGYDITPATMAYVNYSTSFDPQIGSDKNTGDPLRPLEAEQWEIGVKYEPAAFRGMFTAAIYDLEQENYTVNLGGGEGQTQVGRVDSYGLELEAVAELAQGLNMRANYAYNHTEQVRPGDANDGNAMSNAPNHLAGIWLDKSFDNGWRLAGGARYIGERYGDLANSYDLDSVTLVDLGVGYSTDRFDASLNVDNVFDTNYLATCGNYGCYYGEGQTLSAKISYKW